MDSSFSSGTVRHAPLAPKFLSLRVEEQQHIRAILVEFIHYQRTPSVFGTDGTDGQRIVLAVIKARILVLAAVDT